MVEDRTITLDALGDVFSWAFWIWIPEDYAISSLRTSVATASVFKLQTEPTKYGSKKNESR
jgi:hypothetical protein